MGKKELVVMSYNILHAYGLDGEIDVGRIAEVIRETGAELIGVQEVDRFMERSGMADQAAELAEKLGMHYTYGANLVIESENPQLSLQDDVVRVSTVQNPEAAEYGTLILSAYPIVFERNVRLPVPSGMEEDDLEPRGLLEAHVDVEGTKVRFCTTHLGLSEEERGVQSEAVVREIGPGDVPTIFVGDMNALPSSQVIARFKERWTDVLEEAGLGEQPTCIIPRNGSSPTMQDEPTDRIDYIFCSSHFTIKDAEIIPKIVSDHVPIVAKLRLA